MTHPTHGLDPNALEAALTRPIIGIENRTPQEAFDIMADRFRSFLASLPQQTAEPVAWRWRWGKLGRDQLWHLLPRKPGPFPEDGYEVEPLYTHPASPPVGGTVKVKPLRWLDVGTPSELDLIAHTPFDTFQISRDDTCEWPIVLRPFITSQSNYQTVEEAKAAAEAEFGRRILSALASSERSGREAPTHRHKKTGRLYVLIGFGKMQSDFWMTSGFSPAAKTVDMLEVAVYRAIVGGSLWVRPREEFEDGRFIKLSEVSHEH